jgi:hypothetical protein
MTVRRRYAVAGGQRQLSLCRPNGEDGRSAGGWRRPSPSWRSCWVAPMSGESPDCHLPFIVFSQGNATQAPSVAARVVLMGKLLVRCPKTGQAIFTGRYVDCATFRSTPVFFSPNYCPLWHEWFGKDAWVRDSEYSARMCNLSLRGPL